MNEQVVCMSNYSVTVIICGESGLDQCLFILPAAFTATVEKLMMEFKHCSDIRNSY